MKKIQSADKLGTQPPYSHEMKTWLDEVEELLDRYVGGTRTFRDENPNPVFFFQGVRFCVKQAQ